MEKRLFLLTNQLPCFSLILLSGILFLELLKRRRVTRHTLPLQRAITLRSRVISYYELIIIFDYKTATNNFLNLLDCISKLMEQYESQNAVIEKDLPMLGEIVGSTWKKEFEYITPF